MAFTMAKMKKKNHILATIHHQPSAMKGTGDSQPPKNSSDISVYQQSLDQGQLATTRGLRCNEDDRIRRQVIQDLTCYFELRFESIESTFNIDFKDYFTSAWPDLERMADDGLIQLSDDSIVVLPAGRLLVRALCMQFDHYLFPEHRPERQSRAF